MTRELRGLAKTARFGPGSGKLDELDIDVLGLTSLGGGEPVAGSYTGIKALMLAVLDNGIASYLSPIARVRTEAEYWVDAPGQRSPFSFTVVCETLRLEPAAVRAALQRLRDQPPGTRTLLSRRRPNVRREGRMLARKSS
jgi:hypothetical protein